MDIQKENEHLAIKHWQYINQLLDVTLKKNIYTKEDIISQCRFHYLTAWEHGAKHYQELLNNTKQQPKLSQKHINKILSDVDCNALLAGLRED